MFTQLVVEIKKYFTMIDWDLMFVIYQCELFVNYTRELHNVFVRKLKQLYSISW